MSFRKIPGDLVSELPVAEESVSMTSQPKGQVTRILNELSGEGRREVFDRLLPLVYGELRALARVRLGHERPDHSLQAMAFVHEVFMGMPSRQGQSWHDRGHFFRAAAEAMRRILIEHARRRGRIKRGGPD